MSEVQDRIRKRLDDFRKTPKGYESVLRASLALLIVDRLSDPDRPMTQDQLATKVGKRPSFISRVIHGRSNCQFKTAAHILCTLGLPPAIYDKAEYDLIPKLTATRDTDGTYTYTYTYTTGATPIRFSGESGVIGQSEFSGAGGPTNDLVRPYAYRATGRFDEGGYSVFLSFNPKYVSEIRDRQVDDEPRTRLPDHRRAM